jgi:transposase
MGEVFVGHDWAEDHHDIHVQDRDGRQLAQVRLSDGVEGLARFHALIAEHVEDPAEAVIVTETDRGLFVGALVAAGYRVLAVNPLSTSRYRERHSTSGAKSDPGDAKTLAELARTDAHNHRPVAGDSELVQAMKTLTRAHQSLVWTRQRQVNQLRSTLREFYPAALHALPDLASNDAIAVLGAASTPEQGRRLSRAKIAAAIRRGGRQRNIERRTVTGEVLMVAWIEIQTALRAEQLQAPAQVAEAMGTVVASLVAVIGSLQTQIGHLEQQLAEHVETHPDAKLIRSLPGLGMILGAQVLAEFGDDPNRYDDAKSRKSYAGTSPITKASGKHRVVLARYARNPAAGRRLLPVGVRRDQHQPRCPDLLRPAPRRRRHPPPCPSCARQPARWDPPRLPPPPHPLRRTHRRGTPACPRSLTSYDRGMSR